ncbi:hypothetical protein ACJRO7_015380 [Eucalyptus globulus]|uniref:Uncharacterized protein n=1 Tax=Eucalyptus globulus TaxID=34317 RepID=A0ABD3L4H7_EUCGL
MRIANFLQLEKEEEEEYEKERGVAFKQRKEKKCVVGLIREKEEREFGNGLWSLSVSRIRTKVEDGLSHTVNGKDESGKRMFNLRDAGSLLYLIAASRNELRKMENLRKEMELFLQNVREKVRRKVSSREPFELTESVASCLTDVKEVLSCGSHLSGQSHRRPSLLLEQRRQMQLNQSSGYESTQEPVEGIEELEAELEAELYGCITSFGEVMDPEDEVTEFQGGVPPIELERERIKELEASVGRMEQKLSEKEREISWWKDTARLLSHHVSEPSHGGLTTNEL